MELGNTLLASVLLSATTFPISAATELTPGQAATVKPFNRVMTTGRLSIIGEAVRTVPRRTDREGATPFHAVDISDFGNGGNWRVIVDLYKADVEKAGETSNRVINGVIELPKDQAVLIESFDTVTVQGFYRSQLEVNDAITEAVKVGGAYSFYIVRRADTNQGGNQRITAFTYEKDVKKRIVQSPDVTPTDSEVGRAALTAGGEVAKEAEISGVATTASPSSEVGRFFETQSSKGGCYTVTLPDDAKVEELNKATAAMMVPLDSIRFSGNYSNMTEVSYQVTKRAAKKGAKCYHITHRWQERGNSPITSADLYK